MSPVLIRLCQPPARRYSLARDQEQDLLRHRLETLVDVPETQTQWKEGEQASEPTEYIYIYIYIYVR